MTTEQKLAELTARVQVLEDEAAIRRLMADMMAKADDREYPQWGERMASFYTDDGQWTSGAGSPTSAWPSAVALRWSRSSRPGRELPESSHLLGTESIEVQGDGANGTWLCFEPVTLNAPGGAKEAVWIMGRYTCEFQRVGGRWRVRTVQYDGIFCTPYEKGWTKERFMSIRPLATK